MNYRLSSHLCINKYILFWYNAGVWRICITAKLRVEPTQCRVILRVHRLQAYGLQLLLLLLELFSRTSHAAPWFGFSQKWHRTFSNIVLSETMITSLRAMPIQHTHTHTHGRVYDNWILNIHFLKPITRGIHCIPIEPQNRFACQINIIVDNRGCCFCCGVVVVAFVVDSMLYAGRYDTLIRIDCCRYWFYTLPVCAVVDLAILQKKKDA